MHSGNLDGVETGQGGEQFGIDRVLLVGHGGGTAAATQLDLLDPLLGHQADILTDLAERAGHQGQPGGIFGQLIALRVPGLGRAIEFERLGKTGGHRFALFLVDMQGSDRTAELQSIEFRLKSIEPVELAAWTSVARAILNLNETITRN